MIWSTPTSETLKHVLKMFSKKKRNKNYFHLLLINQQSALILVCLKLIYFEHILEMNQCHRADSIFVINNCLKHKQDGAETSVD